MSSARHAARVTGLAVLVASVLCACGTEAQEDHRSITARTRVVSGAAVATLDRLGAFVVQCGHGHGPQDLWTIQGGLHRLTYAPGGVSNLSVNGSGVIAYDATETIGSGVHVLSPASPGTSIVGLGREPAVAPDGRIAFVRTEQSRGPLRDEVYVFDGKHAHKVATFPLVWQLFWHRGRLAAMTGPGRTHLVWDVKHPRQRLTLPARKPQLIQVDDDRELVAAPMPRGDSYDMGVASRSQQQFRRVAHDRYAVAWSPSGRFVLASDYAPSARLSIVDVTRRVTARVGTLACGRVEKATWLPRGAKLPPIPAG